MAIMEAVPIADTKCCTNASNRANSAPRAASSLFNCTILLSSLGEGPGDGLSSSVREGAASFFDVPAGISIVPAFPPGTVRFLICAINRNLAPNVLTPISIRCFSVKKGKTSRSNSWRIKCSAHTLMPIEDSHDRMDASLEDLGFVADIAGGGGGTGDDGMEVDALNGGGGGGG